MAGRFASVLLVLAVLQGLASAQFNVLPVFAAETVISEHKHEFEEKEKTEPINKTDEDSPLVVPINPKIAAGLKSEDINAIGKPEDKPEQTSGGRVKREETFTRTQISGVQRSAVRNADIDSFLIELESDIARNQPKRYNSNPVNQAPSWSYNPAPTTQKSFWKKFGDSIGTTYTQVKTKTKDIYKGLTI